MIYDVQPVSGATVAIGWSVFAMFFGTFCMVFRKVTARFWGPWVPNTRRPMMRRQLPPVVPLIVGAFMFVMGVIVLILALVLGTLLGH